MYRRYFKVVSGPFVDEVLKIREHQIEAHKKFQELAVSIGAEGCAIYDKGGLAGFVFESEPDMKIYRSKANYYLPRKNVAEGKAIWKLIDALPKCRSLNNALRLVGLPPDFPCIFGEGKAFYCVFCGRYDEKVFFINIPWKDVDPEEMAQYLKDREAGKRCCSELDYLQYVPHESMVEVKEWEMLKYMDEMRERDKESKEG